MTDDLGLFNERRIDMDDDRRGPARKKPRRRRKATLWIVGLVVVVFIGGGAWYGLTQILEIGNYDDYAGTGDSDVVIQVKAGDLTGDIAQTLKDKDVVASAKAFVVAGEENSKVRSVQPGYYVMKTKMSGKAAVDRIIDAKSRVGNLQIKAGTQLDDITQPDGKKTLGIFSLISQASCAELNGKSTCVSTDDLHKAAETADPTALGVPSWAVSDVTNADPKHRLEGLIVPGVYEVEPGASAEDLLKQVLTVSSATLDSVGMPGISVNTGFRPYQVLIIASLIEREGIASDFTKISRVLYNRLAQSVKLGLDSTINYELDQPEITTSPADRERVSPYNTYKNTGLPPTPISSPGKDAITAATKPADGTWLYFVKCQKDGTSCFNNTQAQQDAAATDARTRGVY